LTGQINRRLHAGEQHVITVWRVGRDGRKQHSACTIGAPDGEVLARARALWIELKDPTVFGAANEPPTTTRTRLPAPGTSAPR
jgi:hypothetical protein